jgi:cation transport ATPase
MTSNLYSKAESDAILKNALKNQRIDSEQVSEGDLLEAARQMGLDEETVKAQMREMRERAGESEKKRKMQRIQLLFAVHLLLFLTISLIFFSMGGIIRSGPPMLKMFPFFPWVFLVAAHGMYAFGFMPFRRNMGCFPGRSDD